jgi:hypothetical protein
VRSRSRRALNLALDALETRTTDAGDEPLSHPPLLVVGAPRSGSTLLYQALVQAFDVGYLSNRHCRLYGGPSLVERVWHPEPPVGFTSRFGRTSGPAGASECGEFWYRFFRRSPQYVPLAEADPRALGRLRAAVRALGSVAGKPLVFKNLICTLRLAPIGAALPEALFLVVRRDVAANAASLLAARRAVTGDERQWWSAEPPEVESLRTLEPHQQVVEQVRRIEALVDRDRDRLGAERFHEVRYEQLCDDAEGTMREIAAFAASAGVPLARRRPIPATFERSGEARIEPELHERIVEYVSRA